MSCSRCIYRVTIQPLQSLTTTASARPITTSTALRYSSPTSPLSTPPEPAAAPAKTTTSTTTTTTTTTASPAPNHPVSAAPAGTILKGLNYFKNKSDPVALEDHEYPAWLWTVLDSNKGSSGADGEDEGDLYSKSKRARRIASKRVAKLAAMGLTEEKQIPIHHQTIDLPFTARSEDFSKPHIVAAVGIPGKPDGTATIGSENGLSEITTEQAKQARISVKKEKRKQNRAGIKEKNFLGGL